MLNKRPSALLIDLDDTLYEEKHFVLSGYRAVASRLAELTHKPEDVIFSYLHYVFLKFGRSGAFDRALNEFSLEKSYLSDLVEIYRTHQPQIHLYPGAESALREIGESLPLAIVTDGALQVQRKKVAALELSELVDGVIFCDEIGAPKPSPEGFLRGARSLQVPIEECLIVGDDPKHDLVAAQRLGVQAIRVRTGRFVELSSPTATPAVIELEGIHHLPKLIEKAAR